MSNAGRPQPAMMTESTEPYPSRHELLYVFIDRQLQSASYQIAVLRKVNPKLLSTKRIVNKWVRQSLKRFPVKVVTLVIAPIGRKFNREIVPYRHPWFSPNCVDPFEPI